MREDPYGIGSFIYGSQGCDDMKIPSFDTAFKRAIEAMDMPTPLFTKTKKTMSNGNMVNAIGAARMNKFVASGRVEEIDNAVEVVESVNVLFGQVANKLDDIVDQLAHDVGMLNAYMDNGDIKMVEKLAGEIEAKLEVVNGKDFLPLVDALAKAFGLKEKAAKADKTAEAKKALGIKA